MLRYMALAAWLAVTAMASLEDLASCDPLRKDMHCPPDPAFAGEARFDFTTASWDEGLEAFWEVDNDTAHDRRRLSFDTGGEGLAMTAWKAGDAPTLTSRNYLLFGRVSVRLKAAKGPGLITALVMKSDSGDEIDWELLGGYEHQAASNYFHDGKAVFNTYNTTYPLAASSFDAFHTYTVDWSADALAFSIDGQPRATWRPGPGPDPDPARRAIPAARWPQTPMHVKVGLWAVGPDSDPGELAWAAGAPDWARAPFEARFASLDVRDDRGGCLDARPPVRYRYDERTRGWRQVRVDGCRRRVDGAVLEPLTDGASSDGGEGDGDAASVVVPRLSSTLAAVACLCWLLLML